MIIRDSDIEKKRNVKKIAYIFISELEKEKINNTSFWIMTSFDSKERKIDPNRHHYEISISFKIFSEIVFNLFVLCYHFKPAKIVIYDFTDSFIEKYGEVELGKNAYIFLKRKHKELAKIYEELLLSE